MKFKKLYIEAGFLAKKLIKYAIYKYYVCIYIDFIQELFITLLCI